MTAVAAAATAPAGAADGEKPDARATEAGDGAMTDAPNTPAEDGAITEAAAAAGANAAAATWPANAVSAARGEILLTLNQSMKAPKGYAYMPAGDYAAFDSNWLESKKRVRRPSAKVDDGMFVSGDDEGGGMFAAPGDDSAKLPEKPDEECTEEELALRKLQRKEQKRRKKEELAKRLAAIEEAKTKVAEIEAKKQLQFARLPPPRPASARPIKATQPYDGYGVSSYGSKKKGSAANLAGVKKLRDGRAVTTQRLQKEYEVEQARDARRKEMIRRCREVLIASKKHKYHKIFLVPVDPKKHGVPDYFDIIKNPMDMGTVKTKLDTKAYLNPAEFCADMRLIFSNGLLYNGTASDAGVMTETVRQLFETAWLNSDLEDYVSIENEIREHEDIEIRNTPATPISLEVAVLEDARAELEKVRREIEELKRAKQEVIYKEDDEDDWDDEPMPRPKSRSRGAVKRQRDPDEDPDFDFDDARMDEDTYKEYKEEGRIRKEIKRERGFRSEGGYSRPRPAPTPSRDMTFDEKSELTMLLGELPEDKQDRVVQIVSEAKQALGQGEEDEIEINIEELPAATLWKLHKYVNGVLRPKKRKLNAAEQLLEAKMREAQAARELAAVEQTLQQVQETGGSYQDVVHLNSAGPSAQKPAKKPVDDDSDTDTDSGDSDSDTSSMDSAEGAGSNPEKRAAVTGAAAPVDQSSNQFAKEAPGIKQNVSKAAVNVQNPSGWENLASSDAPVNASAQAATQAAIPDDLWNEFEAAAQQKQQLDESRKEDEAQAQAERERLEAEKKAAEEAKKVAEEAAKQAEAKAREEARAKAREALENQEQTIDLEEQRIAMKQFGGDGMGGMIGSIDPSKLKQGSE